MSVNRDPAAGHAPTHTFIPNHGYLEREQNDLLKQDDDKDRQGSQLSTDDEEDDLHDVFDEDDTVAADYATNHPGDITKAFNRQRRAREVAADPNATRSAMPKANPQKPTANTLASIDDHIKDLSRHAGKLRLEGNLSGLGNKRHKGWEKTDRATTEQVLDQRTRIILLQMINRNIVSEVNGSISTGKEANVYHAVSEPEDATNSPPLHRAIKIHKSRIVAFKDRERYVSGDHRFQKGFRRGNNRAMAQQWAEKEFRNLNRVYSAGIPCPKPLHLRLHVIMMELVGDQNGAAASKLKDIIFEDSSCDDVTDKVSGKWRDLYLQLLAYMRIMYVQCRLVHADLSEYNILYHRERLWIIDVGQAVEHDHPKSLEFLRMDIKNVNDFFGRKGVDILLDRTVFDFVTSTAGPAEKSAIEQGIEDLFTCRVKKSVDDDADNEVENEVFRQQFIPQTLEQVYDIEKDVEQVAKMGKENLIYGELLADKVKPQNSETIPGDSDSEGEGVPLHDDSQSPAPSGEDDEDSDGSFMKRPRGKRFEDKDAKKEHKKQVKEEKREKRQQKMPKHVKKRLIKKTSKR